MPPETFGAGMQAHSDEGMGYFAVEQGLVNAVQQMRLAGARSPRNEHGCRPVLPPHNVNQMKASHECFLVNLGDVRLRTAEGV